MNKNLARIERLQPKDWRLFKSLRLKALNVNPNVFSPSSDEFARTDEEWKIFLKSPKFQGFVLYCDDKPVGLTGVVEDRDYPDGDRGLLVMSFIEPAYRKLGYSSYFYDARIEWAKTSSPYRFLNVGHREGNEASRRANQKAGFQLIEIVDWTWPDGSIDKLYKYELKIK